MHDTFLTGTVRPLGGATARGDASMWTRSSDRTVEAVQKVLGEPVAAGLSDRAWKVRTQLMAVSVVAIGLVGLGLHVNRDATVFGFSLSGLTDELVRRALVIWTAYLVVHFVWMAWESFAEWRLRLTGTRVVTVTVGIFGGEDSDYPNDPRQSTLANWWRGEAMRIGNLTQLLSGVEPRMTALEATIREACADGNAINVANATMPLGEIRSTVQQARQSIDQTVKTLSSLRIPASLDRFDRAYVHFLKVQNVRWLLLDVLLPLGVGTVALYFLIK
jgi:hypothetical protein